MKASSLLALALITTLLSAVPGFSSDREGPRYAKPPARPSVSSWPDGLAAIIADKTYLDGYNYQNPGLVIENVDTFYYGGDTEALNSFLERSTKVKGLRMTVAFSDSLGKVNRHVRAGTVHKQEVLGPTLSEIDGESCSWLVSVTPNDWVRRSSGAVVESEVRVLVFLGGKHIKAQKLRLPEWGK